MTTAMFAFCYVLLPKPFFGQPLRINTLILTVNTNLALHLLMRLNSTLKLLSSELLVFDCNFHE